MTDRPAEDTPANPAAELAGALSRLAACLAGTGGHRVDGCDDALRDAMRAAGATRRALEDQRSRIAVLERLALTDELTGLLNRRGFESEYHHVLAAARRYGEAGVLIYIDLDEFKPVNDRHGHAAGDEVLRQVARLIEASVRETDYAARLGGDEFAVLMARTAWKDGLTRAEGLEAMLNAGHASWQGRLIPLRASVGIQVFDGSTDAARLLDAADAAMYQTKRLRAEGGTPAPVRLAALA